MTLSPKTTVICAVWHADPNRGALIREHFENLNRQSRNVNVVYVFDGGDSPPAEIAQHAVVVGKALTIYEAWNVALPMVRTPYVANLNLDDRFSPDAIQLLEDAIETNQADFAGGDWEVCFSQEEVNRVDSSRAASEIPFFPAWPPTAGVKTRLGSGTGERGTFGPAVLWKLGCHVGFPRYPYRMADGYLIRSVGDSLWWELLLNHAKKRAVRVPRVIGRYFSHPEDQAEFRNKEDLRSLQGKALSLI